MNCLCIFFQFLPLSYCLTTLVILTPSPPNRKRSCIMYVLDEITLKMQGGQCITRLNAESPVLCNLLPTGHKHSNQGVLGCICIIDISLWKSEVDREWIIRKDKSSRMDWSVNEKNTKLDIYTIPFTCPYQRPYSRQRN